MNSRTVQTLIEINRRFYSRHHDSFSATRGGSWPGWNRAIGPWRGRLRQDPQPEVQSILDFGCGNGRFAGFLSSTLDVPFRYVGVDSSAQMIELARLRLAPLEEVESHLILEENGQLAAAARALSPFDLIVLFGVLHHVPGFGNRRRLLSRLVDVMAPAAYLIVSFWQFGDRPRFQRRMIDWTTHNSSSSLVVDLDELEPGDCLMAWGHEDVDAQPGGGESLAYRYCHFADAEEAEELIRSLSLEVVDQYAADGRSGDLNLYSVLRRPA